MGFQNGWRGPNIVSDGLVLYLDAGSPNSYRSDFGTTWKDMSGNNYSGSLTNGATYTAFGGGSILLDGTNDCIISNHRFNESTLNELHVSIWVYPSVFEGIRTVIAQGGVGYGNGSTFYIAYSGADLLQSYVVNDSGSIIYYPISTSFTPLNTWSNIVLNCNNGVFLVYTNAVLRLTGNYSGSIRRSASNYPTTIGSSIAPNQFLSGSIGIVQVYNRSLSSQEIEQNYNAQKSRFGL